MDHNRVLAMNHICKKKSCVYMYIKELSKNFPGLLIAHQVNEKVYLSYLYFTQYLIQVSVNPNTALAVKGYYRCRFFNVHQSLVSQGHKDFDHNQNNFIYSKAMWLTGK